MTVTLRSQSNARATTKGSTLTHNELDNNFIHFLDTGIDIVGDDSTGATIKPGDDIKFAGSGTVATAVSGQTLTITGSGISASSTATLTNKTFDVEGTGNSISNIDVADLKSGVLDTDISSVSGSDDTLASAKAIKTYADTKATLSGNTDNTIATVTGANALQGEANLTFDGTTLTVASGGIATTSNGNLVLAPNGTGEVVVGSGSASGKITSSGEQDLVIDTNAGTDSPQFAIRTGQHANDSGPDRGILEFDAKGIGGAVFINNEDAQAYPTGAMILRNNGASDSEIHFGQFGQGPAVGKGGSNTLFFSVYFDPDAKAFSHSDSSSFPGDANVFFGYDFENNQAIMQGNGGGNGFKIDSFGNNSASYANGRIELAGSYAQINGSDKYLQFKNRSGDPSTPSSAANQYAKGGEMFVQDSGGTVTQISPHNDQGEWHFYSWNDQTGKKVKVNMEKMIRKLEDITGETFFETFVPGDSH